MKIKIKTSCSGLDFAYTQGEVVEAPEKRAKDLIKARYAVAANQPAPKTPKNAEGKQDEEKETTKPAEAKPAGAKGISKD